MNILNQHLTGRMIHSVEILFDSFQINLEMGKIFIYTRLGLKLRDTTMHIKLTHENICLVNKKIKEKYIIDVPEFDDEEPLLLILDDMSTIIIYPISNTDNTPERAVVHLVDTAIPKCIVVD